MTRNVNRRPPTWAIIGAVMLLVTAALAATQKGMPEGGAWRIVTLYLHTAVGTTESGSLSTDGTTLDCTLALAGTDVTADDDLIAGDDVDVGDDILLADDITPDSDGVSDLGSSTKAFLNVYADGIKTTLDTSLSIHALGDGSGDTADILFKTAAATTQWTIDQDGDLTAASGNNILVTDNSSTIGASGAELATLWAQAIDDGDGTVDVSAALAVSGSIGINAGAILANNQDLTVATDGGSDIGASAAEVGTVWAQVVDDSDGTVQVAAALDVVGAVTGSSSISLDVGGTGSATEGCVGIAGVAGNGTVSLCADNASGQWDGLQIRGPTDPSAPGAVDMMSLTTTTVTANVGITLATNKDLLGAADGTSDLGASGTELGTAWVQTIDDGDGTVDVAAALAVGGNATITGDVLPEADGTRSLGSATYRMAALHTDSIFVSPVTSHWSTDRTVTATETFVTATGENAETDVTLPNATTVTGRVICVFVSDTTTNNVLVKVATSGKIATSASPAGSGGVAGATGVTASANGSCGCWVSDGTDYDLVLASGTWASP